MNRKALEMESLLPKRTVGSALTLLVKEELISKVPEKIIMRDSYIKTGKRSDRREIYYESPNGSQLLVEG